MQSNMNIINGHFITLENHSDDINSITIENGKIKSFNSPNPNFKTIDIKNNIVIPGFIDSHFHLKNYGKRQDMINLKKIDSIDQIVKLIRIQYGPYKLGNLKVGQIIELKVKDFDVILGNGKSLQIAQKKTAEKFIKKFIEEDIIVK